MTLINLDYMMREMTRLASDIATKSSVESAMNRAIAVQENVVSQSQPTLYNYTVEFLSGLLGS